MCKMQIIRCNVYYVILICYKICSTKIKIWVNCKIYFKLLRLFPHHPKGKSHWRIVFLAATAAQEAHLSIRPFVRPFVITLCFCHLLKIWQHVATFGNIWQLLVTFGNFW